ncbi:MAG: TRIC cation channel family protein [Clostridia bacterium]|nr:TRIC cation channel family protein [Clostridia bacterium]
MSILASVAEMIGVVAAATSGTLLGLRKNFDMFGVIFLAIITTIGGGIIRDVFLGHLPPRAFENPAFVAVATAVALFVAVFYKVIKNPIIEGMAQGILYFDAIGLGSFCAIGFYYAICDGANSGFLVVTVAVFTGIGGGMLRDILANRIPFVLKRDIYAMAAVIGALAAYLLHPYVGADAALYICMCITTLIRVLALKFDIQLPPFMIDINRGR